MRHLSATRPKIWKLRRANGMKCVLVGTGRYPVEELEYWRPDGCLADLRDTQAVVTLLAKSVNNYSEVAHAISNDWNTGVKVSEIGFGCGNNAVLMVKAPYEEQVKVVRRALDSRDHVFRHRVRLRLGKIRGEPGAYPKRSWRQPGDLDKDSPRSRLCGRYKSGDDPRRRGWARTAWPRARRFRPAAHPGHARSAAWTNVSA